MIYTIDFTIEFHSIPIQTVLFITEIREKMHETVVCNNFKSTDDALGNAPMSISTSIHAILLVQKNENKYVLKSITNKMGF